MNMRARGLSQVTSVRVVYSRWEKTSCMGCECPSGRQLDQFDTDIIVDLSSHQNLMQIMRGEGDIIVHRLQGDVSDSSPTFVLSDVPNVFSVFQELTFDLAKMNLRGLASKGLGKLMGAVTWQYPAGSDGEAVKHVDKDKELVYYDSVSASRTWLGWCCNANWCCGPVYKITSVGVFFSFVCVCVCLCVCVCVL